MGQRVYVSIDGWRGRSDPVHSRLTASLRTKEKAGKRKGKKEGKLGAINSQNNNTIVLCCPCRSLARDLT